MKDKKMGDNRGENWSEKNINGNCKLQFYEQGN